MLRKLNSSNATLRTFNAFSASLFTTVSRDFSQHTKTLKVGVDLVSILPLHNSTTTITLLLLLLLLLCC